MDKYRPCPSKIAMFTSDSQHPPRSKHAVYLGGICPTQSQVDILVSDDSLAFCPTMYNSFYLGRDQSQIRIKSEVGTVKHVEALQFFSFYWRRFRRSPLPRTACVRACVRARARACVRVRVCVCAFKTL